MPRLSVALTGGTADKEVEENEKADAYRQNEQEDPEGLPYSATRFLERPFPGDQDRTEQKSI